MRLTLLFAISMFLFSCHHEREEKGEALRALRFMGAMNAFPDKQAPADAYGKAWQQYRQHFAGRSSVQNQAWESLGPLNGGGRTKCIAIDPTDTSVIWLGSASGGLWKSTTGGLGNLAWTPVSTGFPVHGISSIAINPLNHLEMYIGTGETYDYGSSVNGLAIRTTRGSHGIGILKSDDGGNTWTPSLNWLYEQERTVWDMIINPLNPSTILAATTEGIYRSADAGATWTLALNVKMAMDLDMHPSDTNVVFAGVGNLNSTQKGVYRSNDGGQSWQLLSNGLPPNTHTGRTAVHIATSNPSTVFAHITDAEQSIGLYRSLNSGNSWTLLSNDDFASYQGWYSKCLKTRPNDASRIFVGGVYLFSSGNGGQTFSQITDYDPFNEENEPWPDLHDIIFNSLDNNKIYLLTDAGLYRSFDNAQSWRACNSGYNVYQFYQGSVFPSDSSLIMGGFQDRSTRQWTPGNYWYNVGGGDGTFNAFDPLDPNHLYVSSQYLYLTSSNFGVIYQGIDAAFVAPFMISPSNPNILYAGDRFLNRSNDGGLSWVQGAEPDQGNPVISMDISRSNAQLVYVGTAPVISNQTKVLKTMDGGFSFTDISNGLPNRYPRDIAIDPIDDQILYVVFSGFGSGHIFRSSNGGSSWTDISTTLPNVPFHTILVDELNRNIIYAGSDLGVFVSNDSGQSWQTMNMGLPESGFIFDLKYSAQNNHLLAFTHGRGLYSTPLAQINVGLNTAKSSEGLVIYPSVCDEFLMVEQTEPFSAKDLDIYDLSGKRVFSAPLSRISLQRLQLPSGMSTGIYIAKAGGKTTRLYKSR
jgi:photosystem II stability/assembly factor-like uncharacterized protein